VNFIDGAGDLHDFGDGVRLIITKIYLQLASNMTIIKMERVGLSGGANQEN